MLWGFISANGGIFSKLMEVSIVIQHAIPYGKCLTGIGFNFLHGNDPKHNDHKEEL